MRDRLEIELAEHLRPVEAPEELWERIQETTAVAPRRQIRWMALAAALGLMTMGTLWLRAGGPGNRPASRPPFNSAATDCAQCHTNL
jgi:hypothetical protein